MKSERSQAATCYRQLMHSNFDFEAFYLGTIDYARDFLELFLQDLNSSDRAQKEKACEILLELFKSKQYARIVETEPELNAKIRAKLFIYLMQGKEIIQALSYYVTLDWNYLSPKDHCLVGSLLFINRKDEMLQNGFTQSIDFWEKLTLGQQKKNERLWDMIYKHLRIAAVTLPESDESSQSARAMLGAMIREYTQVKEPRQYSNGSLNFNASNFQEFCRQFQASLKEEKKSDEKKIDRESNRPR